MKNIPSLQLGAVNYPGKVSTVPAELADSNLSIAAIAVIIRRNWPKVYFGAVPYPEAMLCLNSINDTYGCDSGREVVNYFLANATTWKGEVARAVKKELNRRVKSTY